MRQIATRQEQLRNAECQCLLWESAAMRGETNASAELAKWEAEYERLAA